MAQLPNSPPSAQTPQSVAPSGPVFHESVAKVRVTPGGTAQTMEYKGKTFTNDGEPVSASELGWNHADLAAAEADPKLVIERFNKDGRLIKKDGTPYPTVGQLTPKAGNTGRKVPNTKPEED